MKGYTAGRKRLDRMVTADVLSFLDGHLGVTWASYDALRKTSDEASFTEVYQNAGIFKAGLDVLESRKGTF